jgi:putative membrane protein
MTLDWMVLLNQVIAAVIFTLIGVVFFGVAFVVITRMVPFSIRKEIEEDQNTSLGIILGSVIIGLALIVAAAVG